MLLVQSFLLKTSVFLKSDRPHRVGLIRMLTERAVVGVPGATERMPNAYNQAELGHERAFIGLAAKPSLKAAPDMNKIFLDLYA